MNDELQKQLSALLESLMSAASNGATWAKGEIPQLVWEKILLGRVEETIYFILFIVLMCLAFRAIRFFMKRIPNKERDSDFLISISFVNIFLGAISFITLFVRLHSLLLVWLAPRLYIIEWLRELIS